MTAQGTPIALALLIASACAGPAATDAPSADPAIAAAASAAPTAAPAVASAPAAPKAPRVVSDPYSCAERLEVPGVPDVIEVAWSPDGTTLAIVHTVTLASRFTGTPEDFLIDALDLRSGQLTRIALGERPHWSGSGRYLSFWDWNGDLQIVDGDSVVASPEATMPDVRWVDDNLYFFEKDSIRSWSRGVYRTVARLPDGLGLTYPRDDAYFSADAMRFTVTHYAADGAVTRSLGLTGYGSLARLDVGDPLYMEWAPAGESLLLRYPDRVALRDPEGSIATAPLERFPGPVHQWTPDGRAVLLGQVSASIPGSVTFDKFAVWGASEAPAEGALPNLLGARAFSPDGELFAGVSRTANGSRLEVFRCGEKPAAAAPAPATIDTPADGRLLRPVVGAITQLFRPGHYGVDVAAPLGSLIVTADRGVVSEVGPVEFGGRRVCVRHPSGLETCYYHTSAPLVSVGQQVARGQPVAMIGMTGVTTGPHVHWEVDVAGRLVDPLTR